MARLAIIVPMLNEAAELPALLAHLRHWQRCGCEVLLVDGGSHDGSAEHARAAGFEVIHSPPGRALQMNAGAQSTEAGQLLFLHADTRLPAQADHWVQQALARQPLGWGRFDVQIIGRAPLLPLIAWMMNQRSRLTGIATGDQALFMTHAAFDAVGGFPAQPLMEDVEISARLRHLSPPLCLRQRVTTSGRRWDQRGVWRTVLLMWRLRFAYWRGAAPTELAARYR